jgi:hypothetical protein
MGLRQLCPSGDTFGCSKYVPRWRCYGRLDRMQLTATDRWSVVNFKRLRVGRGVFIFPTTACIGRLLGLTGGAGRCDRKLLKR